MKSRRAIAACLVTLTLGAANVSSAVQLFDLCDVRLTDSPFRSAQDLNVRQLLAYDPDRLLAPFRIDAGLEPRAPRYPNWESEGLDGHTAGHYLSALAIAGAATGDAACQERLTYLLDELAICQEAHGNGYLGGVPGSAELWDTIAAGRIEASGFQLNGRWVPLYNLHKTFAGLRDAWQIADHTQAREMLIRLADWLDRLLAGLSEEQMQEVLRCEFGGMNEVLADVAVITEDDRYLRLARRFNHQALLTPLLAGRDELNGLHANTQVPKVVGFQRIAALDDDPDLHRAALAFWDAVVQQRSLAFGGNSVAEHFSPPERAQDWIQRREGPETCNTQNMLRLTEQLFVAQPDAALADFYERAVLNHILSTQHPGHGGYVYFTSARPRHYRNYSQRDQSFWCCVGTGMENHGRYGRFIYAHADDALYVNLFIPSRLDWNAQRVVVEQHNRFPDDDTTRITFAMSEPRTFALKLRCPAWVRPGAMRVKVNGIEVDLDAAGPGYTTLDRMWSDGDEVVVTTPMRLTLEQLPHLQDYVAVMYGPVMLAAATDDGALPDLIAGADRMDHIAGGPLLPLDGAPVLVAADRDEIIANIEREPGDKLAFRFKGAVKPDAYADLRLIPFFRLHDARYMMYWCVTAPDRYDARLAGLHAAEQEQLALERRTVDRVSPGEQQPEAEHNLQGHHTSTGLWMDRRFRHARGWFSYDLYPDERRDLRLRVTYLDMGQRDFDILVNDQLLGRIVLDAPAPGRVVSDEYGLPASVLRASGPEALRIKFAARPDSMVAGVFDVRLVTAP